MTKVDLKIKINSYYNRRVNNFILEIRFYLKEIRNDK